MSSHVRDTVFSARQASFALANKSTEIKNKALLEVAENLKSSEQHILDANKVDLDNLTKKDDYSKAFYDRLLLDSKRINSMADGLKDIVSLPDPVGEVESMSKTPDDLTVGRIRTPLGVIGIIYEARPNVTVDAAGLALKSGNAVVLRGSSEAINSNKALVKVIQESLEKTGLPAGGVVLIEDTDRAAAQELMNMDDMLDVLIPRGGYSLIRNVVENSTVPVIETGAGNCHTYVDESADNKMAVSIARNAKIQRPGVCNAMETLLVNHSIAENFLPDVLEALDREGVELRGCPETQKYHSAVKEATSEDWETEYLDLILAVRVVKDLHEAIHHIQTYGTGHSEAIVTNNYRNSRIFLQQVDAAAVYVNASTRFTDGNQFGLGAEMGISTQKLHTRGPMGLKALTSLKYIIYGDGQIR